MESREHILEGLRAKFGGRVIGGVNEEGEFRVFISREPHGFVMSYRPILPDFFIFDRIMSIEKNGAFRDVPIERKAFETELATLPQLPFDRLN